jgi:hypothetical protein
MAQYNSEYSQSTVGSPACNYSTLKCYLGSNPTMASLKPTSSAGVYVTPNYASIGYDALTHGVGPSCKSYFNIQDAYGPGADSCMTSYTTRLCGSGCGGGVGKGTEWVCKDDDNTCVGVHKGTLYPPGKVFDTSYQCQAGCGGGGGKGKGTEWVCRDDDSTCVGVHKGTLYPPGKVFDTSYQCQAGCGGGKETFVMHRRR